MERPTKAGFSQIGMERVVRELIRFKKFMDAIKENFFLISGPCLGLVRDRALIKHDKDFDIGIMGEESLYRILKIEKEFFNYYDEAHVVGIKNGKILWLKKYFGEYVLPIEVVAHYVKDDYVYYNRDLGASWPFREGRLVYPKRLFNTFEGINFRETEFNLPCPVREFLTFFYGNDWKTPKEYTDWRPHCANIYKGYWV